MARRAAAMLKSGRQRAAFGEIGGRIYPNRPLLRCGLEIRSISQIVQTSAVPRLDRSRYRCWSAAPGGTWGTDAPTHRIDRATHAQTDCIR
jgi:hypothetical protein